MKVVLEKQQERDPFILPHGWRQDVADVLGIHRNTVYKALKQGKSHPMYFRIMKVIKETYGN